MKLMEKFFGRRINSHGQEVPDPTPVELPVGYKHPLPLAERMKQMIRSELSSAAAQAGAETWEEANDFDVGDREDDGLFVDEDDEVAPNDPYVEEAADREKQRLRSLDGIKKGPGVDLKSEKESGEGKGTPEKAHSST